MHASELTGIGAVVISQSSKVIFGTDTINKRDLEEYWSASRARLDRWSIELKHACQPLQGDNTSEKQDGWNRILPVLEEVLTSELLTRVWTAVTACHDQNHRTAEFEPVSRSIMIGHLEARNRALNLIVYGRAFVMEDSMALNRLRRRVERWTDMLLAYLIDDFDIQDITFDASRARDYAADIRHERKSPHAEQAWRLLVSALRGSFDNPLCSQAANPDLNQTISDSILSCFDQHCYDSLGLPKSTFMDRIQKTADDTQGLLDELINMSDSQQSATSTIERQDGPHPTPYRSPKYGR